MPLALKLMKVGAEVPRTTWVVLFFSAQVFDMMKKSGSCCGRIGSGPLVTRSMVLASTIFTSLIVAV